MLTAAMRLLLQDLHKRYSCLPDSYLTIDSEFTGFRRSDDLIWNLGACLVREGEIAGRWNIVLDWTEHPLVHQSWLHRKIAAQRSGMRAAGRESQLSWEILQSGVKPEEGMEEFLELLQQARREQMLVVGHGLITCDVPRISDMFQEWLGAAWKFRRTEVLDTGAIEKAVSANLPPRTGETFFDYSKRIIHARAPGVRWNLDQAVEKYGLAKKLAASLHGAGTDALACHLLLAEYRNYSGLSSPF